MDGSWVCAFSIYRNLLCRVSSMKYHYFFFLPLLIFFFVDSLCADPLAQPLQQARANAHVYDDVALKVRRVLFAVLKEADPVTLLIPDHFLDIVAPGNTRRKRDNRNRYSPHHSGADLYPYLVLGSYYTDPPLVQGRMMEMLRNEIRYTTKLKGIPGDYDVKTKKKWGFSMFGAAEYAKDGLVPITERLGRSAWYWRMHDMIIDLMENARTETKFGNLPAYDTELNGDILQVLARLYPMSNDRRFLEWARRIADAYVYEVLPGSNGLPSRKWNFKGHRGSPEIKLRDHGNETIVGLSLIFALEKLMESERVQPYQKALTDMFDKIIASANADGFLYNAIDANTLQPINSDNLADNWGYIYGAVYNFYLMIKEEKYRDAVRKVLSNLPRYKNYRWEGDHYDGFADSIEGAIYLTNREPMPEVFAWIDSEIQHMFSQQQKDGHVDRSYLEGNFIRTSLLYMTMKSQGVAVANWMPGVGVGAVPYQDMLLVNIKTTPSAKKWDGMIRFDYQRHKRIINLPINLFRLNEFPEWFVVDENTLYEISKHGSSKPMLRLGSELVEGIKLSAGDWIVRPAQGSDQKDQETATNMKETLSPSLKPKP